MKRKTLIKKVAGKLKQIGTVGVDSGSLHIGDPCYLSDEDGKSRNPYKDWKKFIDNPKTLKYPYEPKNKHDVGIGLNVGGWGGDGAFPVYEDKDKKGRVRRIIIDFCGHHS